MNQHDYNISKVQKILGARITGIIQGEDHGEFEEEKSYGFRCTKTLHGVQMTYDVWIDRDEEGNGPGHIEVQEVT